MSGWIFVRCHEVQKTRKKPIRNLIGRKEQPPLPPITSAVTKADEDEDDDRILPIAPDLQDDKPLPILDGEAASPLKRSNTNRIDKADDEDNDDSVDVPLAPPPPPADVDVMPPSSTSKFVRKALAEMRVARLLDDARKAVYEARRVAGDAAEQTNDPQNETPPTSSEGRGESATSNNIDEPAMEHVLQLMESGSIDFASHDIEMPPSPKPIPIAKQHSWRSSLSRERARLVRYQGWRLNSSGSLQSSSHISSDLYEARIEVQLRDDLHGIPANPLPAPTLKKGVMRLLEEEQHNWAQPVLMQFVFKVRLVENCGYEFSLKADNQDPHSPKAAQQQNMVRKISTAMSMMSLQHLPTSSEVDGTPKSSSIERRKMSHSISQQLMNFLPEDGDEDEDGDFEILSSLKWRQVVDLNLIDGDDPLLPCDDDAEAGRRVLITCRRSQQPENDASHRSMDDDGGEGDALEKQKPQFFSIEVRVFPSLPPPIIASSAANPP